MKVLFLDFDGVLNSERYVRRCGRYGVIIDPERLALLKKITDATDAVIVLTTSWREHWDKDDALCDETGVQINGIFSGYGLCIFDKTPKLFSRREEEIKAWLDSHPETEGFAVLDDAFLSADFLCGHFVKTSDFRGGLCEQNVLEAIDILNS